MAGHQPRRHLLEIEPTPEGIDVCYQFTAAIAASAASPRPQAAFPYGKTGRALALCGPIVASSQDAMLGGTYEKQIIASHRCAIFQ